MVLRLGDLRDKSASMLWFLQQMWASQNTRVVFSSLKFNSTKSPLYLFAMLCLSVSPHADRLGACSTTTDCLLLKFTIKYVIWDQFNTGFNTWMDWPRMGWVSLGGVRYMLLITTLISSCWWKPNHRNKTILEVLPKRHKQCHYCPCQSNKPMRWVSVVDWCGLKVAERGRWWQVQTGQSGKH